MVIEQRFDCRYGKGALDRLRSMLDDPTVTYKRIAKNLGLTKQRVAQLAKDFGVDGRQREHERTVRRWPRVNTPLVTTSNLTKTGRATRKRGTCLANVRELKLTIFPS